MINMISLLLSIELFLIRILKRYDLKNAVEPDKETIRVYHTNAKRLVKAKMACPFLIKSYGWPVTNRMITQPAVIDPKKNLR